MTFCDRFPRFLAPFCCPTCSELDVETVIQAVETVIQAVETVIQAVETVIQANELV
jgi:Zn ribbon nucleic-acid-binding protein